MKIKSQFKKLSFLFAVMVVLGGCSSVKPESSADVVQKFKETAVGIKAADFEVEAKMKGEDEKDNMDLSVGLAAKVDQREGEDRKLDLGLKLDGGLTAGGKQLSGSLDMALRVLADNFYFKVSKLDSNDPSMAKYKEVVDQYRGKWLQLASDFVPQSVKQLQEKDEETLAREKKLKDLFVSTNLFEVSKEFGVESLNGKKVYHYGIRLNEEGLKGYIRKAAEIDGKEMSDAEVEQAATFAKTISNLELWIGVKDYYLYKGSLAMVGGSVDGKTKSDLTLAFVGNSYGVDPSIQTPENPESFNPITVLMQLQLLNPAEAEGEANVEEAPVEGEGAGTVDKE